MRLIITLLIFSLVATGVQAQGVWYQLPSMPDSGRIYPLHFTANNKLYFGGGATQNQSTPRFSNKLWEFDPATNVWTQYDVIPHGGASKSYVFYRGDSIYIHRAYPFSGGQEQVYHPATKTWGPPQNQCFPCNALTFDAVTFQQNDKWVIAGGHYTVDYNYYNPGNSDVFQLDTTFNTTTIGQFIGDGIFGGATATLGNLSYICGGNYSDNIIDDGHGAYRYNITNNTWSQLPPVPYSLYTNVGFALGNQVYFGATTVYDPVNPSNNTARLFSFLPWSNQWVEVSPFPGPPRLEGAASLELGGVAYVFGGRIGNYTLGNDLYKFVPADITPQCQANICAGDSLPVTIYLNIDTVFKPGNVFTIEMSSSGGSFTSPITLGTHAGTTTATVKVLIPGGYSGNRYIRIKSTNPPLTGLYVDQINILARPSLSVTSNSPVCEGDELAILANTNAVSYQWFGPNSFSSTGKNVYLTAGPNSGGTYHMIVSGSNNCMRYDSITVTVWPKPTKPTLTATSDTLTSSTGNMYVWYRNNIQLPDTGQSIVATQNGYYQVEISDANGCDNRSDSLLVNTVGFSENVLPTTSFNIYPNPVNDVLNVELKGLAPSGANWTITDISGKVVINGKQEVANSFTIQVNDLAPGMYLLNMSTNGYVVSKKVLLY